MKTGKALEIFVKNLLLNVGFSMVKSDGLFVFDGAPGQMIQGLGGAHNADVLLEPPVQTPFYIPTRLLIECKDYSKKAGLPTVRGVLGLREDINNFEAIDRSELIARRRQNRNIVSAVGYRYSYQVAVICLNGYTTQAQLFAAVHRISLLDFRRLPFWNELQQFLHDSHNTEEQIMAYANKIGDKTAVAVLPSGQLLFLYQVLGNHIAFQDEYSLHWSSSTEPWQLWSGEYCYAFHLPNEIMRLWLAGVSDDLDLKVSALNCKEKILSNMVVYYRKNGKPRIKMLSIDRGALEEAKRRLEESAR